MSENLHPTHHRLVARSEKEARLGQRGRVLWLFGLSGSGKTTLAEKLERKLFDDGRHVAVLDGDNVRTGLNSDLGFSDADRTENIRRVAHVARLLAEQGLLVVVCFITPRRDLRTAARNVLGRDVLLVHVKASYETCSRRDPKGLYAKAHSGGVKHFTGRDSAFEEPGGGEVDCEIDTEKTGVEQAAEQLERLLLG